MSVRFVSASKCFKNCFPSLIFPGSNSQKHAFSIFCSKSFLQSLLLWGPLSSLQVENEYGNIGYEDFPRDKSHLLDIERVYGEEGVESLLFTSDSPYLVDDWGNVDGRERDGLLFKKSLCYNTLPIINWHKLTIQYPSFCEYCKLLDGVCKKNAFIVILHTKKDTISDYVHLSNSYACSADDGQLQGQLRGEPGPPARAPTGQADPGLGILVGMVRPLVRAEAQRHDHAE